MTPAEEEVLRMVEAGHPLDHIAIEMAEEVLRLRSAMEAAIGDLSVHAVEHRDPATLDIGTRLAVALDLNGDGPLDSGHAETTPQTGASGSNRAGGAS